MSEWIIRVRDNDRRNMKLSQAEFIDLGSLSKESTCSAAAQGVRKGSYSFVWLAELWTKSWPIVSELELSKLPWLNTEEGIQRFMDLTVSVDLSLKTYSSILGESQRHTFHQDCEGIPRTLDELCDCSSLQARTHSRNCSH